METSYDATFYAKQKIGSLSSARAIVPLVLKAVPVASVVDVGCGVGTWLKCFAEHGVEDLLGYDGAYVDRSQLLIAPERFVAADLADGFSIPRRFELAISLEVAEHLPQTVAARFVSRLTAAAPAVLFSAAIPGQGGTEHVNERWQDWWRDLFAEAGFRPVDLVRPAVWGREDVERWYQQNTVLYCSDDLLRHRPGLTVSSAPTLNLVHPFYYERLMKGAEPYLGKALRELPGLVAKAARRRLG